MPFVPDLQRCIAGGTYAARVFVQLNRRAGTARWNWMLSACRAGVHAVLAGRARGEEIRLPGAFERARRGNLDWSRSRSRPGAGRGPNGGSRCYSSRARPTYRQSSTAAACSHSRRAQFGAGSPRPGAVYRERGRCAPDHDGWLQDFAALTDHAPGHGLQGSDSDRACRGTGWPSQWVCLQHESAAGDRATG